ncbi:MAG: aminotransferase class V-fold PLP-dependent enzyme [Verrucomicrobia bacterium]|nr:aminotransferase class V-fold PLP-dependent enzyme [Verrucomicrobiota bacterium]
MTSNANIVYLDNNATTRVDPAVRDAMLPYLSESYANPSSPYTFARAPMLAIAQARRQVAALLSAEPEQITFTSCGTESSNTALHSALRARPGRKSIVTTSVEHPSILRYCERLESHGYNVTYLPVDRNGQLVLKELELSISDDTAIVSVMWANNETGILFPVREAAAAAHCAGALFHTDAVQACGKVTIDLSDGLIDLLSLSAHKFHGPKGVGALFARDPDLLSSYLFGGEQERGRRAGTENVPGIAGIGKAAELAGAQLREHPADIAEMRDAFEQTLSGACSCLLTGTQGARLPNTSHIVFPGVEAETLIHLLDFDHICCSSGSACASGSSEPSHVLTAMGFSRQDARSALRVSFSRFNSSHDAEFAAGRVVEAARRLSGKHRC